FLNAQPPSASAASAGMLRFASAAAPWPRIAPFAPSFLPATFSPSHAPNNFPIIAGLPFVCGASAPGAWHMFPPRAWDFAPTLGGEIPPTGPLSSYFSQFSCIGTLLDYQCSSAGKQ